ncbi:putative transporter, partial [Pasteurella multocida subsp. multocida str. Anand1_cattle]
PIWFKARCTYDAFYSRVWFNFIRLYDWDSGGARFFASLRQSGLKLNGFAALIVLLGSLAVIVIHKLADVPLDIILRIYSGAVTNTPSLGAGQQILSELGLTQTTSTMGMAYAMAYPFGICGILLSMWLIRLFSALKLMMKRKFLK